MFSYIQTFVSYCSVCQQCKADTFPPKAPLLPLIVPEAPIQFISIDIAHMPIDDDGYQYLLMTGDIFSKYIETTPLKNQTARTVVQAFYDNWIMRHGSPFYLLSDQGSNVDSETMNELCTAFQIEKRRSSAYHSQGNGLAERNIRTVREILRTSLLDTKMSQKEWRKILPSTTFAVNSTESCSTKCIPFKVAHGRAPTLPEDIALGVRERLELRDSTSASQYAEETAFALNTTFQRVARELGVTREKMKRQHDKNVRINDLNIGDKVWIKRKFYKTGESRKLAPRKDGPYTVISKLPNGVNFHVKNDSSRKEKIVHHDRMIPARLETQKSTATRLSKELPAEPEATSSSESDDSSSDDDAVVEHRYPRRERAQRRIPGAIPWKTINK